MTLVEELSAADRRSATESQTVLLLDDDPNTLFVLHAVLERTGARILECEDEPSVLRQCNDLPQGLDLIVADVVLKYTNGPAVVRKIQPVHPRMRLLYISGFNLQELERRGLLHRHELAPGRVEFLQKPFGPEQFLKTVEDLLTDQSGTRNG